MIYRLLADAVVLAHFAFVLFVALGGFLVLKWPKLAWLQVPVFLYGAAISFGGWICPLTPLELRLREMGGEAGYGGGFVENYITAIIYPEGLTRTHQLALGVGVLLLNGAIYAWLWRRRGQS